MENSLVLSDRSIGRLPKFILGSLGLTRRFGLPPELTPERGELFGPAGKFLLAGHKDGMWIEDGASPGHSQILQARLPRSATSVRAEFIPLSRHFSEEKFSFFHVPTVYEFDVKLDGKSLRDNANQSIEQWHGIPNRLLGAPDRHAPFLLAIVNGLYRIVSAATSRLTPKLDKTGSSLSGLERVRQIEIGDPSCDADQWVNWHFEVCWSFSRTCGWWRLYKNCYLVAEDSGPNCYNELRGAPYFQFGIYRLSNNGIFSKNQQPDNKRSYRNITIRLLKF